LREGPPRRPGYRILLPGRTDWRSVEGTGTGGLLSGRRLNTTELSGFAWGGSFCEGCRLDCRLEIAFRRLPPSVLHGFGVCVRIARQIVLRGVGQQGFSGPCVETQQQADLFGRSAHFVPGNPEIVRVPQLRFAVVERQLLGSENILPNRDGRIDVGIGIIERIDRHRAVDDNRLLRAIVEEQDSTTEPSNGLLARLVQDCVAPNRGRFGGDLRFRFCLYDGLLQERSAPRGRTSQPEDQEHPHSARPIRLRFHSCYSVTEKALPWSMAIPFPEILIPEMLNCSGG